MTEVLLLLVAVVAVIGFVLMTRNANLLFAIEVRDGRVVRVRRGMPPSLLSDVEDIVGARPVPGAELRVEREGDIPVWRIKGDVTDGERQRLRNVLGLWPLAKLRRASRQVSSRGEGRSRGERGHLRRIK